MMKPRKESKSTKLEKLLREQSQKIARLERQTQIEEALERVRARSMVMQKSEELSDVATVLFKELTSLGGELFSCGFVILENDDNAEGLFRMTNPEGQIEPPLFIPNTGEPATRNTYFRWKEGATYYVEEMSGEALKEHYDYMLSLPKSGHVFQAVLDAGIEFPTWQQNHAAFFSHGYLLAITLHPFEDVELLKRFAKVFEQCYTRFLDLQKAETQAREAQIEAALERVRAASMAMHHSDDLEKVVNVLFKQLGGLDIQLFVANIQIFHLEEGYIDCYMNFVEDVESNSFFTRFPLAPWEDSTMRNWREGKEFSYHSAHGEEAVKKVVDAVDEMLGKKVFQEIFKKLSLKKFETTEANHKYGCLGISQLQKATKAEKEILKRFAKVFEQCYTRFLDLQNAEAQAREAQIEAALERVRAASMAMHKSEELKQVTSVLFTQLQKLDIPQMRRVLICIVNTEKNRWENWGTSESGEGLTYFPLPLQTHPVTKRIYQSWQKQETDILELSGETLRSFVELMVENGWTYPAGDSPPEKIFINNCFYKYGFLDVVTYTPLEKTDLIIVGRFAKVFEQSYTRFLDLKRAEAQAKEAQIEAALERVRARAMAMHKSEELAEVLGVVFEQIQILDFGNYRVSINIIALERQVMEVWDQGDNTTMNFVTPLVDYPIVNAALKGFKEEKEFIVYKLAGEEKKTWDNYLFNQPELQHLPEEAKAQLLAIEEEYFTWVYMKHGCFEVGSYTELGEDKIAVLKRFTKVLDLCYTRMLDLQNAEAQAIEAQIEAALERVRSTSMAMHKSEELHQVVLTISEEINRLGLDIHATHLYRFDNKETKDLHFWQAADGAIYPHEIQWPYLDHDFFNQIHQTRKNSGSFFTAKYNKDIKNKLLNHALDHSITEVPEEVREYILNTEYVTGSGALSNNSGIFILRYGPEEFSDEENEVLKRFAKVFEQAYVRFLDLQKAETQAREAKIEAALERVRAKAMAMHNSSELAETSSILFQQFSDLGINSRRCGFALIKEEVSTLEIWSTGRDEKQEAVFITGFLSFDQHPLIRDMVNAWFRKEQVFTFELHGEDVQEYYRATIRSNTFKDTSQITDDMVEAVLSTSTSEYYHLAAFDRGMIYAISEEPFTTEELQVMSRFSTTFELTYRRFLDLQKAEAQAREAIKQASLDRVRAQIASMRSTEDLDLITPLIWNELHTLGVPFIRCGVFIIEEATAKIEAYLSDPKGKALAAMKLPFDVNSLTSESVEYWRQGKVYQNHWSRQDFMDWTQSLIDQGYIADQRSYQGATEAPESLYLNFIPFAQGMLYVGNVQPLSEEAIDLVQSLAESFAIAYARYEDFVKLELAKQNVESTLSELQATQKQLIQSEKMASLGELTAGIAHEIKNPLNFVNNFSEVSKELLDELNEELDEGKIEDAKEIAGLLIQNLDKIEQHGKRADAIVRSMLQHSRSSTGIKEPTNINALADEYLRLAYHGMRAKDKSFNVTMETAFDEQLGNIKVIPQDIGRVLLNLITNAFYACGERLALSQAPGSRRGVSERKNQEGVDFKPTVILSTSNNGDRIAIKVKDNGNGIPVKIVDKIFQPFFTTKPAGQGTGLGLSLAYDIVKAHQGEMRVESTEGEGTTFTITLPKA